MPNWTQTPNAIFAAIPHMCPAELRLTFVLVRQIYGYHRKQVRLTYRELMALTGLGSRSSVNNGIQRVLDRGFFLRDRNKLIWRPSAPVEGAKREQMQSEQTVGIRSKRSESVPGTETVPSIESVLKSDRGRPVVSQEATTAVLEGHDGSKHRSGSPWAERVPIPEELNGEPFLSLWAEFLVHLRESGRALPARPARHNLARLASVGRKEAEARLRRSLERNWFALFYGGDEMNYHYLKETEDEDSNESAWQLVCALSSSGKLADLPRGAVRRAVAAMGEERFYRMRASDRSFVKREFTESLNHMRRSGDD